MSRLFDFKECFASITSPVNIAYLHSISLSFETFYMNEIQLRKPKAPKVLWTSKSHEPQVMNLACKNYTFILYVFWICSPAAHNSQLVVSIMSMCIWYMVHVVVCRWHEKYYTLLGWCGINVQYLYRGINRSIGYYVTYTYTYYVHSYIPTYLI